LLLLRARPRACQRQGSGAAPSDGRVPAGEACELRLAAAALQAEPQGSQPVEPPEEAAAPPCCPCPEGAAERREWSQLWAVVGVSPRPEEAERRETELRRVVVVVVLRPPWA
jgi:hypothetical protein